MPLIVLDRDGVINHDSDDFIKSPLEWRPIDGSLEAIARLKQADFKVVVASNQSGLARGLFDYGALFEIHDKMTRMLADLGTQLDGIFFCPHAPGDDCSCRKPRTGLFDDISRRLGHSIKGATFVGDHDTDVQAAQAAGLRPLLVRTGKPIDESKSIFAHIDIHDDLAQAALAIINTRKNQTQHIRS